jgi:hypothetical protein
MRRLLILLTGVLLLAQCGDKTVEVEREVGYRGKARVNPYLAFERYVERRIAQPLVVKQSWVEPGYGHGMVILSSSLLSSELSLKQMRNWVEEGGHAVFLFDHADMQESEWSMFSQDTEVPDALKKLMQDMGLDVEENGASQSYSEVVLYEETYKVKLNAKVRLLDEKKNPQAVLTREWGEGLVTFVSDARLMRNREIDQEQHIDVLSNLLTWRRDGDILMLRGVGISFFGLLWQKGWMVLLALAVWIIAWLMRHMPRFGPVQSGLREDQIRAYDHHLEMIGDFHWRLDRGASLLQPLRAEAQDFCHQWQVRHGHLDEGLFEVMAERAELPVERVQRAMTEFSPRDQVIFTRAVADLQQIRKAFA